MRWQGQDVAMEQFDIGRRSETDGNGPRRPTRDSVIPDSLIILWSHLRTLPRQSDTRILFHGTRTIYRNIGVSLSIHRQRSRRCDGRYDMRWVGDPRISHKPIYLLIDHPDVKTMAMEPDSFYSRSVRLEGLSMQDPD